MTLATLKLNTRDLSEVELAIQSFPGAYGSVNEIGEFKPSVADLGMLVLFVPTSMQSMSEMWQRCGISTVGKSSYPQMREAAEHTIDIYFFKVRKGWFKVAWVGNVLFGFGNLHIGAGSIAGRTQAAMWRQLHEFMDGDGRLYDSTADALRGLPLP
ncbi:MAG: hypothetical protein ACLQFT_20000 [Steroidobacteraceae bacterium]|jgi:hypothetical protein